MNIKKQILKTYKYIKTCVRGTNLEKLYFIKVFNRFCLKYLKSDFAIVQGHQMFLDPQDTLALSINGVFEEAETALIKKIIKKGDVVLDIGANIGYYTLIFAKLVGATGKVFAFEPDPTNFSLLKKNVLTNKYKNVTLIQKAISNKTGKINLYLSKHIGDHRIYDSQDGREHIEIDSIKIDDYLKEYAGNVDFIKMDIQGAECAAIQGMPKVLNKNKNVKITSEFWPIGLKRFGIDPADYLKLLSKHDFHIYQIKEPHKKLFLVDAKKILKQYTLKKENFTNLFCTRTKLEIDNRVKEHSCKLDKISKK